MKGNASTPSVEDRWAYAVGLRFHDDYHRKKWAPGIVVCKCGHESYTLEEWQAHRDSLKEGGE